MTSTRFIRIRLAAKVDSKVISVSRSIKGRTLMSSNRKEMSMTKPTAIAPKEVGPTQELPKNIRHKSAEHDRIHRGQSLKH